MQFLYHLDSGFSDIIIKDEEYRYIFKVRRHKAGDQIALRNLKDSNIYFYRIDEVSRREAKIVLIDKKKFVVMPEHSIHIGWCVIESKTIEKTLPMLNELGVSKISFVYCDRSQRNFKMDMQRLKRILINSSQQCGRSEMMALEVIDSLKEYLQKYPKSAALDFGGVKISCQNRIDSILVGCEGGFSEEERKLFAKKTIYGIDTPLILRSESAAVAIASILL